MWSDDGGWTADSVFDRCQERLDEMVRLMRKAGKGESSGGDKDGEDDAAQGGGEED